MHRSIFVIYDAPVDKMLDEHLGGIRPNRRSIHPSVYLSIYTYISIWTTDVSIYSCNLARCGTVFPVSVAAGAAGDGMPLGAVPALSL